MGIVLAGQDYSIDLYHFGKLAGNAHGVGIFAAYQRRLRYAFFVDTGAYQTDEQQH